MQSPHRNSKLIIYQMLPRLFGNTNTTNKFYGSITENGCGKFNDINDAALNGIEELGVTHIWYTGIIEHATMTDYSRYSIKPDDPDVVKGRAGSPYAIKDYYDVNPDLATDVYNRMAEFEELIVRTHAHGMDVLIDFVPNHVARTYKSDSKPFGVRDFGQDDDTSQAFSPKNDFYYIPNEPFVVPQGYNPGGDEFQSRLKDGRFDENPAKATGDNVFVSNPSLYNWFETIKLNYGVNYQHGHQTSFEPAPPVWHKMLDMLSFWADKGVDGFRCDMVEYVPFEFWAWLIPQMKEKYPGILFIGEAYDPGQYKNYLFKGQFDYLYDKVGLYDAVRRLTCNDHNANTWDINKVWNYDTLGFDERMLRFMENHDEQRIASPYFAGNAAYAKPGMVVTATLGTGPVMLYMGQEVGEEAVGAQGFSGADGRTTIFDYWGVTAHQQWMNGGKFDGGLLNENQEQLRDFYRKLLIITGKSKAIGEGKFYELMLANQRNWGFSERVHLYLRYTPNERILVIANFLRYEHHMLVNLPDDLMAELGLGESVEFADMLSELRFSTNNIQQGVEITIPAMTGLMLTF